MRLSNKSILGIPSDDCVWGFTEPVIHSLVTSQLKKKIIRAKILSKVKTDCSTLGIHGSH